MSRKLLLTGASGRIGNVIYKGLKKDGRYTMIGADIEADQEQGIVEMDIADESRLLEMTRDSLRISSTFCAHHPYTSMVVMRRQSILLIRSRHRSIAPYMRSGIIFEQ